MHLLAQATLVVIDPVSSPALLDAFVAGLCAPVGLFSVWLLMRAVVKGARVGDDL